MGEPTPEVIGNAITRGTNPGGHDAAIQATVDGLIDLAARDIGVVDVVVTDRETGEALAFENLSGIQKTIRPHETAGFEIALTSDGHGPQLRPDVRPSRFERQTWIASGHGELRLGVRRRCNRPRRRHRDVQLDNDSHGATIDSATGLIDWTPPENGDDTFSVVASDGRGGIDRQTWTVMVDSVSEGNTLPIVSVDPDCPGVTVTGGVMT